MVVEDFRRRGLLFNGDVVTKASEFALEADPAWVIRAGVCGVEWCSALWVGVVMIVLGV